MTTAPTAERRRFGMHANLLYDVITKQAGTLQKAILEGVMNGVDADATKITVTLDENRLTVSDDGRGFKDRHEIKNFFETFGTPHQEGDAVYGRFRMGRGQLFAFGKNEWRTNVFRMNVDIKEKGLDYDLEVLSDEVKGCSIDIELYQPLLPSERDAIERELRQWVAFVSIPVHLNGKKISENPAKAKWDVETDDAWFKLAPSRSTLSIYNLGVLVMHAPASRYGTGGVVVSKRRLDVNFARNDVQNSCPVFRLICAELRKHSDQVVARKKRITDHERQHLAERFLDGSAPFNEAIEYPVITDVEGRHHPISLLQRWGWTINKILVAQRGDRQAIKVVEQKLANAVAQETLERFSVRSLRELLDAISARADDVIQSGSVNLRSTGPAQNLRAAIGQMKIATVSDFDDVVSDSYEAIPLRKLTAGQKILLAAAAAGTWPICSLLRMNGRTIHIGHSDVADAWTDGRANIWLNVNLLQLMSQGYQGCARIAAILVHEFMHGEPDTNTHEHDLEFYQRFHDSICDTEVIGVSVAAMMRYLAQDARRRGRAPMRRVALFEDNEQRIIREGGEGSTIVDVPDEQEAA